MLSVVSMWVFFISCANTLYTTLFSLFYMNNIRLFDNLMLKVHNVRQKYTFLISEQLAAGTQGHSRSVGYLQKQETNLDEMDPVL